MDSIWSWNWISSQENLMGVLAVPIAIYTIISTQKNWHSLWDNKLTLQDRGLLMRIAALLITPIIVFFHECGHAVATIQCGGEVEKFYYGFVWGYVIPRGSFTTLQLLWIAFSGNLVEVMLGVVALVIAIFSSAPAVVALGVYVFLWAVGGTLVFYTIMSMMGAYGDWTQIYASPCKEQVFIIGCFHAAFVLFLTWCIYSKSAALWFARKTNPGMMEEEELLFAKLKQQPEQEQKKDLVALSEFYYTKGVYKIAREYAEEVLKADPENDGALLILAAIKYERGNFADAKTFYVRAAQSAQANPLIQAKAYMGAADCHVQIVTQRLRGGDGKIGDWSEAVSLQSRAHELMPELGDPLFYRAELFLRQHLYNRAENDFRDMLQKKCLDSRLFERARIRLAGLMQTKRAEQ
jgi:hypothetical protein